MRWSMIRRATAAVFVMLASAALPGAPQTQWGANAAVVRIDAKRCAGSTVDRVGTGFLWGGARQAVTALHVIAGCTSIHVHSEHDRLDFNATIAHVFRRADLALLTLDSDVKATPFVEMIAAPSIHDTLTTWGYGDTPVSMRSFDLRVAGITSPHLGDNVPNDVLDELKRVGSPAPDIDILAISDPIAPGLSGAPIFDADGHVRGIADGGVHHGATHASWAIPVKYLPELAHSNDVATGYVSSDAHLSAAEVTRADVYSADFVDPAAPKVNCGSTTLRRVRVVPFAEASKATDNPMGLLKLAGQIPPASMFFNMDVYADSLSGATIVLPAGTKLVTNGGACAAMSPNGAVSVLILVMTIPPGQTAQSVSLVFEQAAGSPMPAMWRPDAAWTYVTPAVRADGLVVNRKAFAYYYPPNQYNFPTRYMFETLATRGQTFLGVAGFRNNDLAMYACNARLQGVTCPQADYLVGWAQLALSVHLATFPVTAGSQKGTWTK